MGWEKEVKGDPHTPGDWRLQIAEWSEREARPWHGYPAAAGPWLQFSAVIDRRYNGVVRARVNAANGHRLAQRIWL